MKKIILILILLSIFINSCKSKKQSHCEAYGFNNNKLNQKTITSTQLKIKKLK